MKKSAVISQCKTYRYELRRDWNPQRPRMVYVMLNPSTADANIDDPTIRKCIGFADRWGYGGFTVVNLFAFRATDPKDLLAAQRKWFNVIGPENNAHIKHAVSEVDYVIAAWGAVGGPTLRALEVAQMLPSSVETIKPTSDGHPSHPLMMPYNMEPQKWEHPSLISL